MNGADDEVDDYNGDIDNVNYNDIASFDEQVELIVASENVYQESMFDDSDDDDVEYDEYDADDVDE